jgi:uncharacterized protein
VANIAKALKEGVKAVFSGPDAKTFVAADRQVRCTHCGSQYFFSREAQLNTSGMTLLDVDWLNTSGTALVCSKCTLIQWFLVSPEQG